MKGTPKFGPYDKPEFHPGEWLLSIFFPVEAIQPFHPINDMRSILGYQYRLSRAEGVEPTGAITQLRITPHISETSVKRSIEGEYVEVGTPKVGDLQFPERSLKVTVFPIQYESPMEPTQEQISVESLEPLNA